MKSNAVRVCPICSYTNSHLLFIQHFTDHFSHRISSCDQCGFVYVKNIPSQTYYRNYYQTMSKYEGVRQHEIHLKPTYNSIYRFLKVNVDKSSKILDAGCSTGYLLNRLKKVGFRNVYGFDPAPKCKIIAETKYGLTIETSDIAGFHSRKKFDFIIISQVLEHLPNVKESIEQLSKYLSEKGFIFIGVPDVEAFSLTVEEPFGEFSTEHINFFSQSSLYRLMLNYSCCAMKSTNGVIFSIWKKGSEEKLNVLKYIEKSERTLQPIKEKIDSLPEKIIVWGAGSLSQRLLKTTRIRDKIIRFVDRNNSLVGTTLGGIKIISPEEVSQYDNPILISSFRFRQEIISFIKDKKYTNEIITLNGHQNIT